MGSLSYIEIPNGVGPYARVGFDVGDLQYHIQTISSPVSQLDSSQPAAFRPLLTLLQPGTYNMFKIKHVGP